MRLCNYSDVYNNNFITLDLSFMEGTATQGEIDRFSLAIHDVVITKDSETWKDIGVPALVLESAPDLVCGYHLAILRPLPGKMYGPFLFHCLQARPMQFQFELAASGVTRYGLGLDAIGRLRLPVPPYPDQEGIAVYLDRETALIDGLIAAKERMLKLLVEKRQALITHAVIRGVNPSAPMKDSGIPWLGQVPAHWEVERARWLFRERDERSTTGDEEMLTVSHITGVTRRSEKDVSMFEAESNEGYKKCFRGDLAINTLWAWMGAMGVAPTEGIVSPAYNVYEPNQRLMPAYVDALVRLSIFAQEVTRYSKGVWSSRLRLYPEGFFEVYLPLPPDEEQTKIANYIISETNRLNNLITAVEKSISLLKERRSALISAAVTGRIGIPKAVHNEAYRTQR